MAQSQQPVNTKETMPNKRALDSAIFELLNPNAALFRKGGLGRFNERS
jgi:hypothetical protein